MFAWSETMSSTLTPIAIDFRQVSAVLGSRDAALLDLLLTKYREELEEVDELADELEEEDDPDSDEDDDPDSRQASLQALSKLLGQAKQSLQGGRPPDEALKNLGRAEGVSPHHQRALNELLGESAGAGDRNDSDYASASDVLRHLITGEKPARRVVFPFMYGHAVQFLCQHLGENLPHDRWHDLRGSAWAKNLDKALKTAGVPAKTLSVAKHLVGRGAPFEIVPRYADSPTIGYLTREEAECALAGLGSASLDALDRETRGFLEDIRGWLQSCVNSQRDLICFGA
jgi:hypothetical protein